jgi:hypothetical protein
MAWLPIYTGVNPHFWPLLSIMTVVINMTYLFQSSQRTFSLSAAVIRSYYHHKYIREYNLTLWSVYIQPSYRRSQISVDTRGSGPILRYKRSLIYSKYLLWSILQCPDFRMKVLASEAMILLMNIWVRFRLRRRGKIWQMSRCRPSWRKEELQYIRTRLKWSQVADIVNHPLSLVLLVGSVVKCWPCCVVGS